MKMKQAEKEAGRKDSGESQRCRVRRLVLDPLQRDGFRFKVGTPNDVQVSTLARMADALAYMSDNGLRILRQSLATKGEGNVKVFWPAFATVIGLAEAFEKRPLKELPNLLSWFASAAGREALVADRLVAEYDFWVAKKRPPISDQDWRNVAGAASELKDRAMRAQDKVDRGVAPPFGEGEWLAGYRRKQAYVEGLVAGARG